VPKYDSKFKTSTDIHELLQQSDVILEQLKQNSIKAQQRMKKVIDQKRQEVEFEIGDMVLVKLQPYRQNCLALRKNQKLGLKYFGPFPIIQRVGQVVYKLLLKHLKCSI